MSQESETWFLIYCKSDDSHCLVPDNQVVYEDPVHVGDRVQFSMKGHKKMFDGEVQAIGEDYDALMQLQDNLNSKTKPKRDRSFNVNQPRRAKEQCKKIMGVLTSSTSRNAQKDKADSKMKSVKDGAMTENNAKVSQIKSVTIDKAGPSTKSTGIIGRAVPSSKPFSFISNCSSKLKGSKGSELLGKVLTATDVYTDSSDDSNSNCGEKEAFPEEEVMKDTVSETVDLSDTDDSDSSDEEITEEDLKVLQKLSKKKKGIDIKALLELSNRKPKLHDKQDSLAKKVEVATPEPDAYYSSYDIIEESKVKLAIKRKSDTCDDDAKAPPALNFESKNEASRNEESLSHDQKAGNLGQLCKRLKLQRRVVTSDIEFEGEFFKYKESDAKVVQLTSDYQVFVKESDLKDIKGKCRTSTAIVRSLVRVVFTEDAQEQCSVSGRPSTAKGIEKIEVRPKLDQDGVNAIVDFATRRAEKKKWPKPSTSTLKQAMGNVLCEQRDLTRAKNMLQQESQRTLQENMNIGRASNGQES